MQKFVCSFYLGGVCNFSCSYCHQSKTTFFYGEENGVGYKNTSDFSDELIIPAIEIISYISQQNLVHINFFGGETFLYAQKIEKIFFCLQKNANLKNISISISTNGSIIHEGILQSFDTFSGIKSIIDLSWHILEHPQFQSTIEKNVGKLLEYHHISFISTVVVDKNCYTDKKKYLELFSSIYKLTEGKNIVLNVNYACHWNTQEIADLLKFFSLLYHTNIYQRFHIQIETINCGALLPESYEIFFLPNGEVVKCPYLVMDKFSQSVYKNFSCGHLLHNTRDEVIEKLYDEKKLFCKDSCYNAGDCFFLGIGVQKINEFILKYFS